jgi:hypothetical protein
MYGSRAFVSIASAEVEGSIAGVIYTRERWSTHAHVHTLLSQTNLEHAWMLGVQARGGHSELDPVHMPVAAVKTGKTSVGNGTVPNAMEWHCCSRLHQRQHLSMKRQASLYGVSGRVEVPCFNSSCEISA